MTSADGGHWAFESFWVAWQMQVTNGETNRLFEDNEISQYKKETQAANVQQWLADKEILFACPKVDDCFEMSCA